MSATVRVRVRIEPTLAERTVTVPPQLAEQQSSEATIEFGIRSTFCRVNQGVANSSVMLLSRDIAENLAFEGEMRLNARREGSTLILGPLIGIVADLHPRPQSIFGEQTNLFIEFSREAAHRGAVVFIFSPYDIRFTDQTIRGYVAQDDERSGSWLRKRFPFPRAVYDRAFYHPDEEKITDRLLARLRSIKRVTFLNSVIGDKWVIHRELSRHPLLMHSIPETILLQDDHDLRGLLDRHGLVYLKPAHGSQGRGIIRVEKRTDGRYILQYSHRGREVRRTVSGWAALSSSIGRLRGQKRYLAQRGIHLLKHHGALVDLRIIVQKTAHGDWSVTGMAARVGRKGSSVTNLHRGGHAIAIPRLLEEHFPGRAREITSQIEHLSCSVAAGLERAYGHLSELGVDLGLDRYGKLWYIESNPKPGRRVFILIGAPETRRKSITRPLEYAMNMAGFPPSAARRDEDGE